MEEDYIQPKPTKLIYKLNNRYYYNQNLLQYMSAVQYVNT